MDGRFFVAIKCVRILSGFLLGFNLLACSSSGGSKGYSGLGKDSVSDKVLAEFAPQPLPSDVTRKIQNYLDVRSPGLGILSVDKKNLFFTWRVTGTSQVWRLNNPKGFPIQMTGGEDPTGIAGLTMDGKYLVLSRDRNGEENPGLYLQATSGGALKVIQHKPKVQTIFEFASDDSKFIFYRANDVKADSFAFYKFEIETGKSELLFSQDGYWFVTDHQDDKIILSKAITNIASEHFEFDIKTKSLKPIIGQNEKEDYSVLFSSSPGKYFVITPKLGEFKNLYIWDMKALKPLTKNLKWDVAGMNIDRQRSKLIYSINEAGSSQIKAINAKTYQPISLPPFKNADQVYAGSFSKDGTQMMIGVETSKGPRTSYSYNFSNGQLVQWVYPSAPEVDLSTFVRAELESYKTRDGVEIPMFVRRPPQCQAKDLKAPCPVVVHFHGGPEAQSMKGFSVFAQMFIDEGIIFVEPNVRGSDGYGKTWLDSDNGPKRLNVISDIEDAALFIKKNWAVGGIAPKVGVMGWSYGGYSTLIAMSKFAGAYDAGVALVGMSNLYTFLMNTAPYRRALRTPEYGDPEKDKEALAQLSAVTFLDKVKSPLMVIQGATDPRVPVGEAIQIHKELKDRKIASPLIIFADEGHGTSKRSNKVLELGHALQFLKQNLL
jgi:dipeptidyl aminopeptidase/acylaminoacyl peptidase